MTPALLLPVLLQAAAAAAPAPTPAAPAPAAPPVAVPTPWVVARTTGTGPVATSTSVWSQDGKARLVVRCDTVADPIVSIQFIPKPGFPPATPRPVSINADDNGWLGSNWQFPGNGAFVSDDVIVTNLAAIVAHARQIRVRVIDPDNAPVEATFAGPPSDAPLRAVLTACTYELGKVPPRSMPKVAPASPATPPAEDE